MTTVLGTSCAGSIPILLDDIRKYRPSSVLDLGCGIGVYGKFLRETFPGVRLIGVDGYFPYLASQWPSIHYDVLVKADLFEFLKGSIVIPANCVLCLDVVEHQEKPEAQKILDWVKKQELSYISTPMFWMEQEPQGANELERHKCFFSREELQDMGWILVGQTRWNDDKGYVGVLKNRE